MKETLPDGNTRFVHQRLFSPYILNALSANRVMRITKCITKKVSLYEESLYVLLNYMLKSCVITNEDGRNK